MPSSLLFGRRALSMPGAGADIAEAVAGLARDGGLTLGLAGTVRTRT